MIRFSPMRKPENQVLAPLILALDEASRQSFFERVDQLLAEQKRVFPVEAEAMVFIEVRAEARAERDRSRSADRHPRNAVAQA
jgi:hypothetical protein